MEASWQDLADGAAILTLDAQGQPENPLLVLDLEAAGPPPADLVLAERPQALIVGISTHAPPAQALPYLTCWVTPEELTAVANTVAQAPLAALALGTVLKTPRTSAESVLFLESVTYSSLLAGTEFQRWLRDQPSRLRAPDPDPVLLDRVDDVVTITLNRPQRHNAYSAAMRDRLGDALDLAFADPEVHIVLRGAGPSFCSGGDLAEFGQATDLAQASLVRTVAGTARSLATLSGRTRAELHGACVGAGMELAAFAGRVEATSDTWFRLPEVGMGLIPGAGGTLSIPARIGRWRTAQLALTQCRLDAVTAHEWGLIDAVVG